MILNITDFTKWTTVSAVAIRQAVKTGRISRRVDKMFNTRTKLNQAYAEKQGVKKQPDAKIYVDQAKLQKMRDRQDAATPGPKPERKPMGRPPGRPTDREVLENNGKGFGREELEKQKLQSQIDQLNIKVNQAREALIDRDVVRRVFGESYQIDVNEFLPLATNLAAEAAGLCGVDDPKAVNKITALWEKHLYKVLKHRKKLLNIALKKMKAEEITDEI